jgi:hypothetical protein
MAKKPVFDATDRQTDRQSDSPTVRQSKAKS